MRTRKLNTVGNRFVPWHEERYDDDVHGDLLEVDTPLDVDEWDPSLREITECKKMRD